MLRLMERRLALTHEVARWKWDAGKPITDPQRERELLQSVVERGRLKGLDPELVRSFFAAQLAAARLVQQADFERLGGERAGAFRRPDEPGGAAAADRRFEQRADRRAGRGPPLALRADRAAGAAASGRGNPDRQRPGRRARNGHRPTAALTVEVRARRAGLFRETSTVIELLSAGDR
ncbi:MAG: chorismate mutase [Planctomycetaceae bacterium]|nr:chorismate mutase [Planctomycetaceae bacterium]